jgi:hypothetical protein
MTHQLTARELKEQDPRRFEKEYWDWTAYAGDYGWHEFVEEDWTKEMLELGLHVETINFEDRYGWSAAITGHMPLARLIEHLGMKEQYLALWHDAQNFGAYVSFGTHSRIHSTHVRSVEYSPGQCSPEGVFKDLPQEAWDVLVEDQFDSEDWEKLAIDWLRPHTDTLADRLEKEYGYITSEEQFLDSCEANEITFEVEGEKDEV